MLKAAIGGIGAQQPRQFAMLVLRVQAQRAIGVEAFKSAVRVAINQRHARHQAAVAVMALGHGGGCIVCRIGWGGGSEWHALGSVAQFSFTRAPLSSSM